MDVALGVVLGMLLAASLWAGWRLLSAPRRVIDPGSVAMQGAVHAAISLLPDLRRGLSEETARPAAAHLRLLTGADAVALAGRDALLSFDGAGADHHRPGDPPSSLAEPGRRGDVRVLRRFECGHPGCPLQSAIVAPLMLQGEPAGSLVALYERPGRVRVEESRVVAEAAALVSAMIELSELDAQGERLARAELLALRAQISPHFIYNALTAVASFIHSRPEEARELLGEFSEFIRYAFSRQRPYVTLADELQYVEKYLRLEQARFGERLRVRVQVDPEVLQAVVPVLSLQPLVENAVRHGVESRPGGGRVEILGRDLGADVELRVCDDGEGIDPERARRALAGEGPGIGLGNVHGRLQSTFGRDYGLAVEHGSGTTVVMTLPKFRAGVRAA
jgi:two-component system LytT family sensor kinase